MCRASNSIDSITSAAWDKIKCKALNWKGLDTFGNIYDSVDWELGLRDKHVHSNCRVDISSSEKLSRSKTRQQKRERKSPYPDETSDSNCDCDPTQSSTASKCLRSSVGIVHDKHLCVWRMQPEDTQHYKLSSKLLLISYTPARNAFRSYTAVLQDLEIKDRINRLIDSTPDPFAAEIRYHRQCWQKYVVAYQRMSADKKIPLLQNLTLREAQTMFIDHARQVIFVDHEIKTLQGLLRDYQNIIGTFGFQTTGTKSTYVKEVLVR